MAREFNAVARFLKTIKADPKHTHISYFSDQIGKTITDFEKSFREYHQYKYNPRVLEERLTILESMKAEAEKRIEDQNVTYDWWAVFNLRLLLISEEPSLIQEMFEENRKLLESLRNPTARQEADIEIAYNKELAKQIDRVLRTGTVFPRREKLTSSQHSQFRRELEELNLEEILFEGDYTSQKLESILSRLTNTKPQVNYLEHALTTTIEAKGLFYGDIDILKTHEETEELLSSAFRSSSEDKKIEGSKGKKDIISFIRIKEKFPEGIMFFTTDELGIMAFNRLEDKAYFVNVSGKPLTADGYSMNPFRVFGHDVTHITLLKDYPNLGSKIHRKMLERIDNMSKSDREKAELALFMYHHESGFITLRRVLKEYYKGLKTNLSQSELRQLIADVKKYSRIMMTDEYVRRRFFEPDDLQTLLPESMNVNNRQEVKRYLTESADIFSDVLLTVGNFEQAL